MWPDWPFAAWPPRDGRWPRTGADRRRPLAAARGPASRPQPRTRPASSRRLQARKSGRGPRKRRAFDRPRAAAAGRARMMPADGSRSSGPVGWRPLEVRPNSRRHPDSTATCSIPPVSNLGDQAWALEVGVGGVASSSGGGGCYVFE